jgi:two-component system nitrate/nitrite response regulator NarL
VTTSVAIADDHPIVLRGLSVLIDSHPEFKVVAAESNGTAALRAIVDLTPDIAEIDLNMHEKTGLEVLEEVADAKSPTRVVLLAATATDAEIFDVMSAGASGFLFKDETTERLIDCLRAVATGEKWASTGRSEEQLARELSRRERWEQLEPMLTGREAEVVQLVASGVANKDIAYQLNMTPGTAKVHLNNIFRKLKVSSRAELVSLVGAGSSHRRAPD